jgi:hypothetical protein
MTKFKKLLSALLLLGALASCGETPVESEEPKTEQPSEVVNGELEASLVGICQNKTVYLTTAGQSDTNIVGNVLNKAGATGKYTLETMLKASDVAEGSVVLLTLGSSSKGLGAAGVDEAHEQARAAEFAAAAKEGKFTLVLFHVGGVARRGTSSDPIIEAAFDGAKACFVVAGGNSDKFFTNLASSKSVSLYSVEKATNLVDYAKGLFGLAA